VAKQTVSGGEYDGISFRRRTVKADNGAPQYARQADQEGLWRASYKG
jgi:hypothetical protein